MSHGGRSARNPHNVTIPRALRAGLAGRAAARQGLDPGRRCSTPSTILLPRADPLFPKRRRQRAIDAAVAFDARAASNGEDGLGGIYPGDGQLPGDDVRLPRRAAGLIPASPRRRTARSRSCSWLEPGRSFCQPCPLAGVGHRPRPRLRSSRRAGRRRRNRCGAASTGLDLQAGARSAAATWSSVRPEARLWRLGLPIRQPALPRSRRHRDGGDRARPVRPRAVSRPGRSRGGVDRRHALEERRLGVVRCRQQGISHLSFIPFADHGALLDPPTADVSARCVGFLAQLGDRAPEGALAAGLDFLRREQEEDGSWFGRGGTNYIDGTWSVLVALEGRRPSPGRPDGAPRGALAPVEAAPRWRLG